MQKTNENFTLNAINSTTNISKNVYTEQYNRMSNMQVQNRPFRIIAAIISNNSQKKDHANSHFLI